MIPRRLHDINVNVYINMQLGFIETKNKKKHHKFWWKNDHIYLAQLLD